MFIDKNIEKFQVFSSSSVMEALEETSKNGVMVAYSVSSRGKLEGIVAVEDLKRWIVNKNKLDSETLVSQIANKDFLWLNINYTVAYIEQHFSQKIKEIPLLDEQGRLRAIAFDKPNQIQIGNRVISSSSPSFIIAEIGNNHQGDMNLAKKLVSISKEIGADAVKFQMRNLNDLYLNKGVSTDLSEDLGSQYVLELLSRYSLDYQQLFEIFDYCKELGIEPLCSPWEESSLEHLTNYGLNGIKIASADLSNIDFVLKASDTGIPLLISTGMSLESEINTVVSELNMRKANFVLLHCNSTYPAPFKDINLNYMRRLSMVSGGLVGYSGHERGISIPVAAVALGARVIEKHITLDKSLEGNDHKVSLLPQEFKSMIEDIRNVEVALGSDNIRSLTQGEIINREVLSKSLVATKDICVGKTITEEDITVKAPGKGLKPIYKHELIGLKSRRTIKRNDFFYESDLNDQVLYEARNFSFPCHWGIPVRFHDFHELLKNSNPDLLEFHLSFQDLKITVSDFFSSTVDKNLVVHCPELFENDHILDLMSFDDEYRNRSIKEVKRVIDFTLELAKFFPKSQKPLIVMNMGGFSLDKALTSIELEKKSKIFEESMDQISNGAVEILPQTMPPYPWHFGGQRFHNFFVNPQEVVEFCRTFNSRICLDVSHSLLACNAFGWDFKHFLETCAPYTAHYHIADSSGVDGEGLQIGEGEMDFMLLARSIMKMSSNSSFIPEIWQGHKNNGEGFWIALNKLEMFFKGV